MDASERQAMLEEVARAGFCSHPIRLAGATVERNTGELRSGPITVACKDRRAAVCPSCARVYKGDAWQLVAAGLRGGKGVPSSVVTHPRLFVTLTAPGFGPVHRLANGNIACRPRRRSSTCSHGVAQSCTERHGADDPLLGEPLCVECFDYPGAVLWNGTVGRLWQRTARGVLRALAAGRSMSEKDLRAVSRVSYLKVAEFQRRGLVHFHVVVRADGPEGPGMLPPPWLDAEVLGEAVRHGASITTVVTKLGTRVGWGRQLDVSVLGADDDLDQSAVAAYVAKYSAKTSDAAGALARPIRSRRMIEHLGLRAHPQRLVTTAWDLGAQRALAELRLREHAHTFGYRGHFTTKSLTYSATFGALRRARRDRAGAESGWEPLDGGWRYLGRGYEHPGAERLAEAVNLADAGLAPRDGRGPR